jgi:hypothetical protein
VEDKYVKGTIGHVSYLGKRLMPVQVSLQAKENLGNKYLQSKPFK